MTAQPAVGADTPLATLIDPRSIAIDVPCADATDALRQAAELLVRVDAVDASYADALIAREREYPTGLPTEPFGVALPHADLGVKRAAIALLKLRTSVAFTEMATDRPIGVRLLIVLAVPAGDAHVQALADLAGLLQESRFLTDLVAATTVEALYATFQRWAHQLERNAARKE